eukprot:scaffold2627_cov421-Prasinococcus_capsulatus_cf.AAC.1
MHTPNNYLGIDATRYTVESAIEGTKPYEQGACPFIPKKASEGEVEQTDAYHSKLGVTDASWANRMLYPTIRRNGAKDQVCCWNERGWHTLASSTIDDYGPLVLAQFIYPNREGRPGTFNAGVVPQNPTAVGAASREATTHQAKYTQASMVAPVREGGDMLMGAADRQEAELVRHRRMAS